MARIASRKRQPSYRTHVALSSRTAMYTSGKTSRPPYKKDCNYRPTLPVPILCFDTFSFPSGACQYLETGPKLPGLEESWQKTPNGSTGV